MAWKSKNWWPWAPMALLAVVCALGSSGRAEAAGEDIKVVVDTGFVSDTTIVLDAASNPVISYIVGFDQLRVVHCGTPSCSAGNVITPTVALASYTTSIVLDVSGNPVIAYRGGLVHCGDPACGSGNVFATAPMGEDASLALDGAGNPVVSFSIGGPDYDLYLLHCDDPACVGGGDTAAIADADGGTDSSLALDSMGNPVLAYEGINDLTITHCNDPNCAGGDESTTTPDMPSRGWMPSLVLDAVGNPVVAHIDNGPLKLLHCNDPDCSGDEATVTVDTNGYADFPSLQLDSAGNPVVAYNDGAAAVLKLLRCDDPNCDGDAYTVVDSLGSVGFASSLALDASGSPVISHMDVNNYQLKLVHCAKQYCDGDGDDDGCANFAEQQTAPGSEMSGGRRHYKNPHDYFNPTGDRQNRVDDVLAVVGQYYLDDTDGNPGEPPYVPGYNPDTDRTLLGPDAWDTGPPNGLQRIDDVLYQLNQYFHDCA